MSMHPSLRKATRLGHQRTVLSRRERLEKMLDNEQWETGQSVFGLPKMKGETIKLRKKKTHKKEEKEEEKEAAA